MWSSVVHGTSVWYMQRRKYVRKICCYEMQDVIPIFTYNPTIEKVRLHVYLLGVHMHMCVYTCADLLRPHKWLGVRRDPLRPIEEIM